MFPEYATPTVQPLPNMGPPPATPDQPEVNKPSPFNPAAGAAAGANGPDDPLRPTGGPGQAAGIGGAAPATGSGPWRGRLGVAGAVLLVSWAVVKLMED